MNYKLFLHLSLDAHDDFLFLTALAGVGDHIPQEPGHIRLVAFCRFLDRFEIHNAVLHVICIDQVVFALSVPIITQESHLSNKKFENQKIFLNKG